MKTLLRSLAVVGAAFLAMLATACASTGDLNVSPRTAVFEASRNIEPVLDELTALVQAGAISDNVADDIAEYGPQVQTILAAYFDGAEACLNVDGQLGPEPTLGRICSGNALNAIYDALDAQLWQWAIKAGLDTKEGQTIVAGRLVPKSIVRPSSGGPFPGYRNEPDVPLGDFMALRARLKLKFETLVSAAAARARLTAAPAGAAS